MFRAPINRSMKTLDRSLFKKTVQLKAARIFDNKNISRVRGELERNKVALFQDRLGSVYPDPDPDRAKTGKKCVLLRPEISRAIPDGPAASEDASLAHAPVLQELARQELITIVPYDLTLDYKYWTYHDVITSILPEDEQGEIPSGFSQVGRTRRSSPTSSSTSPRASRPSSTRSTTLERKTSSARSDTSCWPDRTI